MTDMNTGMPFYWQGPAPMAPVTGPDPFSAKISADMARQQQQMNQWNTYNPWANTPGGFGAQTAYYAGQGAAYGRATGGFHPSVFTTGAAPYNAYGNPALGAGQPNYFGPSSPVSQPVDNSSPAAMAYLQHYPDVAASGMSAAQHWQNFGQKEGREPWGMNLAGTSSATDFSGQSRRIDTPEGTRFFNAKKYNQDNPDVFKAGADPWQHYNQYGAAEGRALPMSGIFDPNWYLNNYADVKAAGVDPTAHYMQYGQNEGRVGGANPLIAQRQSYADRVRDDPNLSLNLAARLYSEDQNNPDTRTAIVEAMMNRLNATGQDPLNLGYYPKDPTDYNKAYEKVSSNNDLLNQIHQEMERAFGGSNLSNYATDWGSADVADTAKRYATPTWTSPTNEQFFRKDISNDWAGATTAAKNKAWYENAQKFMWPNP